MDALRRRFPRLLHGVIEGGDVYLLMADCKGQPGEAIHYRAWPEFRTAIRVFDSGVDNFDLLCGEDGFC